MIVDEVRKIKSTPRELRKFALTMAIPLALVAGLLLWRQKDYYWCFFVAAGLFVFPGLLVPALLKPIHKVWMTLAIMMGWVMTRVILSLLFFLVLTPTALLLRLLGKDLLNLKFNRDPSESYWMPRRGDDTREPDYTKPF